MSQQFKKFSELKISQFQDLEDKMKHTFWFKIA